MTIRNLTKRLLFLCFIAGVVWVLPSGCRTASYQVTGSGGGVQLGPVDIELRSYGQRLPCFVHQGQFYVVGRRGMPYSIWIQNRTARRLEVVVAVDGRDVVTGRRLQPAHRGYILNPYRYVNITGYRTSLRTVAAFRFSAIHRSYAARMGSAWFRVGSIRVAVFTERESRVLLPRPLVQKNKHGRPSILYKRSFPMKPPTHGSQKAFPKKYERGRHRFSQKIPPSSGARHPSNIGGMQKSPSFPTGDHGFRHPTPREGLGTAFGQRKWAPARYTRFVRASAHPTYSLTLLYNNCAGYRHLNMCTPWCPCYRQAAPLYQSSTTRFSTAP